MFSIKTRNDVLTVAKTFGVAALNYAIEHGTVNIDTCQLIRDTNRWANRRHIEIENVNDGNVEFSVSVLFDAEKLGGDYYTNLDDCSLVRTGFGSYNVSLREAKQKGYVSTDKLNDIMNIIAERNAARVILGL